MKNFGLLITLLVFGILLSGCGFRGDFNLCDLKNDCEVEEPEIIDECQINDECGVESDGDEGERMTDDFLKGFTGNVLNGIQGDSFLITGKNTLYFNDKYGFAIKLGEEWSGAKIQLKDYHSLLREQGIENTEAPSHVIIELLKPSVWTQTIGEYYSIVLFGVYSKSQYDEALLYFNCQPGDDCPMAESRFEDTIIGHNNKYYFNNGFSNMGWDDIHALFDPYLDCVEYADEINGRSYPYWDCSETYMRLFSDYHFYNIMSDLPSILEE